MNPKDTFNNLVKNASWKDCEVMKEGFIERLNMAEGNRDLEAIKTVKAKYEQVRRRQKKLEEYRGANATPKEVVSAELLNALIRSAPEFIKQHADIDDITISQQTVNDFSRPETKYLLDAILYIMDDYAQKRKCEVTQDGGRYLITIDFKDLLKKTGATGDTRKKIKKLVLNALANRGQPLQYLTFEKKSEGRIFTKAFVTIEEALRQETNTPTKKGQRIEKIQLSVSSAVYKWIESYSDKLRGDMPLFSGQFRGQGSMGFMETPRLLQRKIDDVIGRIKAIRSAAEDRIEELTYLPPRVLDYLESKPTTYWREPVEHVIYTWETGRENRKRPMEITWKELRRKRWLSEHRNHKERRAWDIECLFVICTELHRNNEIMKDCEDIALGPLVDGKAGKESILRFSVQRQESTLPSKKGKE